MKSSIMHLIDALNRSDLGHQRKSELLSLIGIDIPDVNRDWQFRRQTAILGILDKMLNRNGGLFCFWNDRGTKIQIHRIDSCERQWIECLEQEAMYFNYNLGEIIDLIGQYDHWDYRYNC